MGVVARRADGAARFRPEEPVDQRDDYGGDDAAQNDLAVVFGNARQQIFHPDVDGIHAEKRDVRPAFHDAQVDGIKGRHRENPRKDPGNLHFRVQKACQKAAGHAARQRGEQRQERVGPRFGQHGGNGAPGGERAVYGKIGKIQHPERDVYAERHDAPKDALCQRPVDGAQ